MWDSLWIKVVLTKCTIEFPFLVFIVWHPTFLLISCNGCMHNEEKGHIFRDEGRFWNSGVGHISNGNLHNQISRENPHMNEIIMSTEQVAKNIQQYSFSSLVLKSVPKTYWFANLKLTFIFSNSISCEGNKYGSITFDCLCHWINFLCYSLKMWKLYI